MGLLPESLSPRQAHQVWREVGWEGILINALVGPLKFVMHYAVGRESSHHLAREKITDTKGM